MQFSPAYWSLCHPPPPNSPNSSSLFIDRLVGLAVWGKIKGRRKNLWKYCKNPLEPIFTPIQNSVLFFSFDKSAKCIRQIFENVLHFQTGFVIHLFELFQASELPYKLCILYFLFFMQNTRFGQKIFIFLKCFLYFFIV